MTTTDVMARRGAPSATTLKDEFRFFTARTTPRIIAPLFAVSLIARVGLGAWSLWDAILVVSLVAVHPFTEWMIHVYILHWKPRSLFGRRIDPLVSRKHREHHRDPREVEWIFIPLPVLAKALPLSAAAFFIALPTAQLAVTATTTGLAILLGYEWTHYLIHSRYKPKTSIYRYVWRAHRLHHFKNENFWFGVTVHMADHVLGTFPLKEDVETSPTCRTLGLEEGQDQLTTA